MGDVGKLLILFGAVLVIIGGLLMLAGKLPGLGRLPGDFFYKGEHFTFYFPIVTCLLISVALSLLLYLFRR